MVDVRFSQLTREASVTDTDAETIVSQLVRETSIKVVPTFVRTSQIVREVSVEVFFLELFMSQMVRETSVEVAPVGTPCTIEPILLESSYPPLIQADWIEPVTMETAWLTDISRSKAALAEDRMIAYRRPLRTITAKVSGATAFGDGLSSTLVNKMLKRLANNRNPLPIWQDRRTINLTATTGQNEVRIDTLYRRFYPGQRVGIARPDGQQINYLGGLDVVFVQIAEVLSDRIVLTADCPVQFDAGWDCYPMIDCDIVPRSTMDLACDAAGRTTITGLEISGCMTLPASSDEDVSTIYDYIDGYPVLDVGPNWIDGVSYDIHREAEPFQSGRTQMISASGARAVEVFNFNFGPVQRADFWDLLRFFDSRRGRAHGCWIIHPQTMWTFVGSGLDYIDVRPIGYANDTPEHFTHVAGEEADGTIWIRPISACTLETGPTRHRIHLDAISVTPTTNPVRVTAAVFCRGESDTAKETWVNEELCIAFELGFRGLLAEGTVEIE